MLSRDIHAEHLASCASDRHGHGRRALGFGLAWMVVLLRRSGPLVEQ